MYLLKEIANPKRTIITNFSTLQQLQHFLSLWNVSKLDTSEKRFILLSHSLRLLYCG